jgi:hypothetical protein
MYILIEGLNNDIGGFKRFQPALICNVWSGLAEVSDAEGEKLLKYPCVEELNEMQWFAAKKKVNGEAIAYREFTTHKQVPNQNPNAVYAEPDEEPAPVADDPKELLSVEEVAVDRPLDDIKPKATKKTKGKK